MNSDEMTLPMSGADSSINRREVAVMSSDPEVQAAVRLAQKLTGVLKPPRQADEIGRLGPYRILGVLGSGGMGVVLKAEDSELDRAVAIKVMKPELAAEAISCERFLREAKAVACLEHDHIVAIHHVGHEENVPYIVMPLLQGETLQGRLKVRELPLAEILRIGWQTAEGLEQAHRHGLIHRDVKPDNLWLEGNSGRVKVLDFGLAHVARKDADLTQSGVIMGTPAFMSPEQARGKPVNARSDLFSLGSVLYRLCTGQNPFRGDDSLAVLTALATETPKAPHEVNPAIPRDIWIW